MIWWSLLIWYKTSSLQLVLSFVWSYTVVCEDPKDMELLRLFTVIFILFGDSMVISSQNLLENILGLDDGTSENEQYTTAAPTVVTASPKINNYALRNNLLGSNPNLYNRVPNTRPNLGFNSNKLHNGLTNPTINLLNQQNPRIQNNVMQKVNQGNYEDDDVKLAAQQFPALQKLLERLKELNRQKELDKQKELPKVDGQTTEASTTTENNNANNNESQKDNAKFKAMRKRKFYFQVLPVVPDNEKKDKDMETVYYED